MTPCADHARARQLYLFRSPPALLQPALTSIQPTHHRQQQPAAASYDVSHRPLIPHLIRYHGLLSSLPRSPTPTSAAAGLPRCSQPPPTTTTPPSTAPVVTNHHNACRQLPALPWPSPHQAAASSPQMSAQWCTTPSRALGPLPAEDHTTSPINDHGFLLLRHRSSISRSLSQHPRLRPPFLGCLQPWTSIKPLTTPPARLPRCPR